jgi:hypothetical protein
MKPTNKLRFIERTEPITETTGRRVRILQQWWESSNGGTINLGFGGEMPLGKVVGEWRDVPVEVEA